jgi:hypothetical protein
MEIAEVGGSLTALPVGCFAIAIPIAIPRSEPLSHQKNPRFVIYRKA